MKMSEVFQRLKGKVDPEVTKIIMDQCGDIHELKRQQGENLAAIAELAHAVRQVALASGQQLQVVEVLARQAGVKVKHSEEFLSEDLDSITGRFDQ